MAETWVRGQRAAPVDRAELAVRRAAAERARRSAVELVAEAGACQQRAEELRRELQARRLRAAAGRGSGAQGRAGQDAGGGVA